MKVEAHNAKTGYKKKGVTKWLAIIKHVGISRKSGFLMRSEVI